MKKKKKGKAIGIDEILRGFNVLVEAMDALAEDFVFLQEIKFRDIEYLGF